MQEDYKYTVEKGATTYRVQDNDIANLLDGHSFSRKL